MNLSQLVGLGVAPGDLNWLQMTLRAVVVFAAGLVMVRFAAKRFFARKSAFDLVLSFVLASMLARAINGSAPLFPTIGAGFVLVAVHRLLAIGAAHWHWLSWLIKGREKIMIENGAVDWPMVHRQHFSEGDLLEELRLRSCSSPAEVQVARLERSGEVSVIKNRSPAAESPGAGQGTTRSR